MLNVVCCYLCSTNTNVDIDVDTYMGHSKFVKLGYGGLVINTFFSPLNNPCHGWYIAWCIVFLRRLERYAKKGSSFCAHIGWYLQYCYMYWPIYHGRISVNMIHFFQLSFIIEMCVVMPNHVPTYKKKHKFLLLLKWARFLNCYNKNLRKRISDAVEL